MLLIRTAEAVSLYELDQGQRVARWQTPESGSHAMAGWFGAAEGLLIGDNTGVYEVDYGPVDDLIRQQQGFAVSSQIARSLEESGREDRWKLAEQLRAEDRAAAEAAQINLCQALLQRQRTMVPDAWFSQALTAARPAEQRMLGYAAHAGGRFDWSARALDSAAKQSPGLQDAQTLFRLAECKYLLGQPQGAADDFLRAAQLADAPGLPGTRLEIETIAALVAARRATEARQRVQLLSDRSPPTDPEEAVEFAAAKIVAQSLVGMSDETEISAGLKGAMVVFSPTWPNYADDIEFFVGEIARLKGNLAEARARYQRCIDLSRDPWPESWARLRLSQLRKAPAQ